MSEVLQALDLGNSVAEFESAPIIERFRGRRSEYDVASLAAVLAVDAAQVPIIVKPLVEIGFLEPVGENFRCAATLS